MKPDLDTCDIEGLKRRHDELMHATRALHDGNLYLSATERVRALAAHRTAAAQRFVVAVVLALFGAFAVVLAISMSAGATTP